MRKIKFLARFLTAGLFAALCSVANAYPTLQLGIVDGTYNTTTQTVVASSPVFSLYAFLKPDANNTTNDTYWLSMALSPQVPIPGGNFGSFSVNGTNFQVTADMIYGTPPADNVPAGPGDLGSHSVYPTYFQVMPFFFSTENSSGLINVQTTPGVGPITGTGMYYNLFDVNVTNIAPGYSIHFDLYRARNCTSAAGRCTGANDLVIEEFAPFSHDAESQSVPAPGSLWLLGAGLVGLGLLRRRKSA